MGKAMQRLLFFLLAAFLGSSARAADAPKFELKDGDRVVFLGDTFIEREQLDSYIETMLTIRFPDRNVVFRNLGWSADTPLGESRASFDPPEKGFDRLKEHLQQVKPSVVMLSHGMANSFKGQPGLAIFEGDMRKLCKAIEDISGPSVRFLFLGPIPHEKLPLPLPDPAKHNENLKLYSDALKKLAAEKNAPFVDLFHSVAALESKTPLTDNGIHLSPFGYWRVAQVIESALSLAHPFQAIAGPQTLVSDLTVTNFKSDNKSASFEATPTRHVFAPAPARAQENRSAAAKIGVKNLSRGDYVLRINGAPVAVASANEWSLGVDVNSGPLFDQTEQLRQTIIKKNQLYFYRWRPQNETYLFGFRKHEQGQNGREIPMFDPLVSEQEGKIAQLKKFKPFKFEFTAATPQDRRNRQQEILTSSSQTTTPPSKPETKPLPLPTFEMAEGLEATLYAEDPELAKPIQMNFDTEGRLWVASSSVYPQIQPGQTANDKIVVLEDTNHDGKVDKAHVFAEGLLIPTGVIPGDGGCYVANSTELLFFKDTDGDGKADSRRVVLSGFGTEDTHHILHTLRWGFDGQLYFNQSIYIHSHIETPHGVMRLNSGGIWNFRPETGELGIHMKGLVNCWGHHYDKFGQSFATDGASGGEGIEWVVPQGMYFTYAGARRVLHSISPGNYPKFASLEMIESEHFPSDWMGTLVTCDFRAHRVVRFSLNENGSSYITKELPDVMRTTNVTFRPIDVKVGPDGALYIADWSNPIIQHGEVDFRDPRRDHEHGRIWRVTAKGRPLLKDPALTKSTIADTFDQLLSPNNYVRERARRILTEKRHAIMGDLQRWTAKQTTEQAQLEALWIYQSIDVANAALLEKLLNAKDYHIRAAAVRVLSFWRDRLNNPTDLLARLVMDEHPRVRMEAMRALAKIPTAKSAELVLAATEKPMDEFLEYAAWLSVNDLAEPWIAAIKSGDWKPAGREKQLAYGLTSLTPEMAAAVLPTVLPQGVLPNDGPWIDLIGKAGSPAELTRLFNQVLANGFSEAATARAYASLGDAARTRNIRPTANLSEIEKPIQYSPEKVRL
jgi:glucose/arabinose dehydrogenase